jgi:hypothetical protein
MGTCNGKLIKVGRRTVMIGTINSKFDLLFWKNNSKSLFLNMMTVEMVNNVHSRAMFMGLWIDM